MTAEEMYFQGELPVQFVQRVKEGKPVDIAKVAVAMAAGSTSGSGAKHTVEIVNKRLKVVDSDDDVAGDLVVLDQLSFINWDKAATAWSDAVRQYRPADYAGVRTHLQRCRVFASLFAAKAPTGYKRYHRLVANLAHQAIQVPGRRFDWAPECSMARLQVFALASVGRCTLCTGDHDTSQHYAAVTGALPPPPLCPPINAAPRGGGAAVRTGAETCMNFNKGTCSSATCQRLHVCRACGDPGHIYTSCPKREAFGKHGNGK